MNYKYQIIREEGKDVYYRFAIVKKNGVCAFEARNVGFTKAREIAKEIFKEFLESVMEDFEKGIEIEELGYERWR